MKYLVKPTLYLLAYSYVAYKMFFCTPLVFTISLLWNFSYLKAVADVKEGFEVFYRSTIFGLVMYEYKTVSDFVNGIKTNEFSFHK